LSNTVNQPYLENVARIADPAQRLHEIILQRVRHAFDNGAPGRLREVTHRELGDPTDAHEEIRVRYLRPMRDMVARTVAELLGVDVADPLALRCAFSIQSQLVSLARLRTKPDSTLMRQLMDGNAPTIEKIDELAEHLTTFVMAGMQAASRAGTRSTGNGIALKE
jgi:hypothetical protein